MMLAPPELSPAPGADKQPAPAPPPVELTVEVLSDCTGLPREGYACYKEKPCAGFAVTLAVRATLTDEQADAVSKGAWPAGLRLWRSSIRGVSLLFYSREGGKAKPADDKKKDDGAQQADDGVKLVDVLHCQFSSDRWAEPDQWKMGEPRGRRCTMKLLPFTGGLNDSARLLAAPAGLVARLDEELGSFVNEASGRWTEGERRSAIKRWFNRSNSQGSEEVVEAETPPNAKLYDPAKDWSFAGYCAELSRHYPLNTDAHLGFVVPVPVEWLPWLLPQDSDKALVVAVPWFGGGDEQGGPSELTTELPSDSAVAATVGGLVEAVKKDGGVGSLTIDISRASSARKVTVSAQPKLVAPIPDENAILDFKALLVRFHAAGDQLGGVDGGHWREHVEPCVHASFLLARHAAAVWETLWAKCEKPDDKPGERDARRLALLRDWVAALRDMTGVNSWRRTKAFDDHFSTASETQKSDARSRRAWMLPELIALEKPSKVGADLLKELERRNGPNKASQQLTKWGQALPAGLHASGQAGELVDALVALTASDPNGAPLPESLAALARLPAKSLSAQAAALAEAMTRDDVLRAVILEDWFAHQTPEEARTADAQALRKSLAERLASISEDEHGRGLHVIASRTVAAPLWDMAVNGIEANSSWVDPTPAVAEMLRRRGTDNPGLPPTEYEYAQPRLGPAALAALMYDPKNPSTGLLVDRIKETMRPARHAALSAPRSAGAEPTPLVIRVDRPSPSNVSPAADSQDFFRRLSGYGVLLRRREGTAQVPWSCVNVGVRAIDGVTVANLIDAQKPDGAHAREELSNALRRNGYGIPEHVSPLRLGFVTGLRQTSVAYDGRSLIGDPAEALWPQDAQEGAKPEDVATIALASPLFWLTPGLPRVRKGDKPAPWCALPGLRFGGQYEMIAFAVLNAGALAPFLASGSHVCLPETNTAQLQKHVEALTPDRKDVSYVASSPYERTTGVGAPTIDFNSRNPLGKGVFGASPVGVELLAAADQGRVLDAIEGVDAGDVGVRIDSTDLALESVIDGALTAPCEVKLSLTNSDRSKEALITLSRSLKNGETCNWTLTAGGESVALPDVPARADITLKLTATDRSAAECPMRATVAAAWDHAALAERAGNGGGFAGLVQERPQGPKSEERRLRAIVRPEGAGGDSKSLIFGLAFAHAGCRVALSVKATGADALIGQPKLLVAEQGSARRETAVYNVPRGSSTALLVRPPTVSLTTWARSPLRRNGADVTPEARAQVVLIDRLLRKAAMRPATTSDRVQALVATDPTVTHLVFELAPLFRPDGHTGAAAPPAARVAVELTTESLERQVSALLANEAFGALMKTCELLGASGEPLYETGTPLASRPVPVTVTYTQSANSSIVKVDGDKALVSVSEGEAVQLRCYAARKAGGDESALGLAQIVRGSLRTLTVGGVAYVVSEPTTLRLDALPTASTMAQHVPTPAELLSCLRAAVEPASAGAAPGREVLLTLDVPPQLTRRFAFVKDIEGRRQQWRWRGEVFPRDGEECHPVPASPPGAAGLTAWGDQQFGGSLARWETLAAAAQADSAHEAQKQLLPWRATRVELLRRRIDSHASLQRLTAAVTTVADAGAAPTTVVAELRSGADSAQVAVRALRQNAGLGENSAGRAEAPVRWKRLFAPCVLEGSLPAPKVWLALPMSRGGDPAAGIASALVLTIGGAFEHAGWGEDLACQVLSVTDTVGEKKVAQWDVGSVPGHSKDAFRVADGKELSAKVHAGPVGHTLDPAHAHDPLITASSYIVKLDGIDEWLRGRGGAARFSGSLDARVRFRRVLRKGSLNSGHFEGEDGGPAPSEWTPPILLRFGVDAGDLAGQLGLARATFTLAEKPEKRLLLKLPASDSADAYINGARDSNYQMWVLLTRLAFDATTDTELFVGIAPLLSGVSPTSGEGFAVATAGETRGGGKLLARVLLVQADLQDGGQGCGLLESKFCQNLGNLANVLMPWKEAGELDRDPWNLPEARARVVAVSDHVTLEVDALPDQ